MLHIHVREGRGIDPVPPRVSCQPYVRVTSGSVSRRSRAVDSHVSPYWNQTLHLLLSGPVTLSLIDSDPFGTEADISHHTLSVPTSFFEIKDYWLPFTPGSAEVLVTVQLAPPGHPPFQPSGAVAEPVVYPELIGPNVIDGPMGFGNAFMRSIAFGRPEDGDIPRDIEMAIEERMRAFDESNRRFADHPRFMDRPGPGPVLGRGFGDRMRTFWRPPWRLGRRPDDDATMPFNYFERPPPETGERMDPPPDGEEPPPRRRHRRR
jgi:hypothetical protein